MDGGSAAERPTKKAPTVSAPLPSARPRAISPTTTTRTGGRRPRRRSSRQGSHRRRSRRQRRRKRRGRRQKRRQKRKQRSDDQDASRKRPATGVPIPSARPRRARRQRRPPPPPSSTTTTVILTPPPTSPPRVSSPSSPPCNLTSPCLALPLVPRAVLGRPWSDFKLIGRFQTVLDGCDDDGRRARDTSTRARTLASSI